MTAGKAARRRRVALGLAAFVIGMHVVAYFAVAGVADAVVDKRQRYHSAGVAPDGVAGDGIDHPRLLCAF
jgi:hypothetical protein